MGLSRMKTNMEKNIKTKNKRKKKTKKKNKKQKTIDNCRENISVKRKCSLIVVKQTNAKNG